MISETTEDPFYRQIMDLEYPFFDTLVKLNDMSLESINPNQDIQMQEINISNHRNSNKR